MIWAGPSRQPSCINALTFGRAKITLKLSGGTLKQPRVRANDRPELAGRLARRHSKLKTSALCFPQRTARRGAWEKA